MASLADLMKGAGLVVVEKGDSSPQGKAVAQALSMVNKLDTYGDNAKKLDYKGSNQLWWSGKAKDGKRAVRVYYNNKVMKAISEHGEADFGVECDDSVEAVKNTINQMITVLESKEAVAAFEAEEKRRAGLKAKKS